MQKALEIAVILSAVDRMTRVIDKATNNAVAKFQGLQKTADAVSKKAFSVGRDLATVGLIAGAALAYPIKSAADFESGMADVRKVVDGLNDSKALAEMGKDIRVMSRDIPIATGELQQLVAAGGRMGVPKAELLEYTKLVSKMAIAFDTSAAQIGEDMGRLATVFNIPIQKVGALADAVNYLDDNAISKGPDIIEVMRRVGGTAQQIGLSAPRVAALASTFLTLGSSAEKAATASNAIIRELAIATIQPQRFQDGLAKLGLKAKQVQDQMTVDPQNTILGVLEKINKLPQNKQIEVTTQIFGKEYGGEVAKLSQGLVEYRRQLELLNNPKLNGSVQREFAIRVQTTNAQMQLAKNNITELAVVVGSALLPIFNRLITIVRPIVQRFAEWAEKNQDLVAKIGLVVAGIAAFSLAGSGVAFLVGGIAKGVSFLSTSFLWGVKAIRAVNFALYALRYNWVVSVLPALTKGFAIFRTALLAVGRAALANPVILVIAAIAAAAYLIYKNWAPISAFFKKLWSQISSYFSGAWEWIKNISSVFYNAGKNIVLSIWEGIKSLAMKPVEAIKSIVTKIREFLPFSPAKVGPLKDLHRVKIIETIAATMRPGPMVDAMQGVAAATTRTGGRRSFAGGGSSGVNINFAPTINLGAGVSGSNRNDILTVLRQYQPELIRLIEDAMERKNRSKF